MDEIIDAFPMAITADAEQADPFVAADLVDETEEPDAAGKLLRLANKEGDFSEAISLDALAKLGNDVVEDYERDKSNRDDWEKVAKEALSLAAQDQNNSEKTYPWKGASNVRFPLLTTAALQFNARAYPAIVKGDEAISCKVVGQDKGRPQLDQQGQPVMQFQGKPVPPELLASAPPEAQAQLEPMWEVAPGGKAARAARVSEYMNATLFYRMEDWESDTDSLLIQLPVVGCAFRKVWYDAACRQQKSALVSALRIFVPEGARSCETTPRLTEEIPDVYPHQISEKQRAGFYRDILLEDDADEDNARLLLEQHRMMDLDEDGLDEPYVITVDHKSRRVLRIEANFGPEDVQVGEDGTVLKVKRRRFYIKYDFFPHPQGKFYGIGLGHLLKQLGDVVDTSINQIVDAATAQTAGGGFIASGVRLQARGGGSSVRFAPGEYKTVDVPGAALRDAIVERTLPSVSPVTFQVLDLILGAARDISGVKDVITGEASNNGQVGTTLALIEQGLQVFNAVYKRIYRALRDEFGLLYENIARYGGEDAARDYAEVLDDPAANFEADFNSKDLDIRPVSDPSSVTRMQKAAKAQFLMGTMENVMATGGNPQEIMRRVFEAFDVEDIDKIYPPAPPQQPDPAQQMMQEAAMAKLQGEMAKTEAQVTDIQAGVALKAAKAQQEQFQTEVAATQVGRALGALG